MARSDPYRRLAGVYDRIVEPMQAGVRRIALDVIPPQRGWHVLDVGCGTGTGLLAYVDAGCVAAGVDVSPSMLERARARLGDRAELHLVDGDRLPFGDGTFDLVTTTMVLHEVGEQQRSRVVTEMARVLKDDGRALIVNFRFGSLRGWRGPTFKLVSIIVERLSGHYSGYRGFRAGGGIPGLLEEGALVMEREKITAGGNVAIYIAGKGA